MKHIILIAVCLALAGCVTGQMGGTPRIDLVNIEVAGSIGGALYVKGEPANFASWAVDGGKWVWNRTIGRLSSYLLIGGEPAKSEAAKPVEPEKPAIVIQDVPKAAGENNAKSLSGPGLARGTVTTGPEK